MENQTTPITNRSFSYENDRFAVLWEGFVYVLGIDEGEASIINFLQKLSNTSIEETAQYLKGHYYIQIKDKSTLTTYSMTDAAGIYHAYFDRKSVISTDYFEVIQSLNFSVQNLSKRGIAEFLHWGNFHGDRTHFDEIYKIEGQEIFVQTTTEAKVIAKKDVAINDHKVDHSIDEYFNLFAKSIRNKKVSLDLTGGIDSRLLAALLMDKGIDFNAAISGNHEDPDTIIAKEVSKTIQKELHVTVHNIDNLESELLKIFDLSNGMIDASRYHRISQHQKKRKSEGNDLALSGVGGEIYKDFSWLHEFPFYGRKTANLERFYNFRFCPIKPNLKVFTKEYHPVFDKIKLDILKEMKEVYTLSKNTETYDHIYLKYKWPQFAGIIQTLNAKFLQSYAPLVEMELAKQGFGTPIRMRVFNLLHRKLISHYSPILSRMETTEGGMSVSYNPFIILQDSFKYVYNRGLRFVNKLLQITTGRTLYLPTSPNHKGYTEALRNLNGIERAIKTLQSNKIIESHLTPNNLDKSYLGKVFTLGLFIDKLSQQKS